MSSQTAQKQQFSSCYCSDPRQLFINLALLVMESCKNPKTEEIPAIHCLSSIGLVKSTKASSRHTCNLNTVQCPKVEQLRVKLINLWNKTASAEMGVILQFDECFQCKRAKSILFEKWKIQFLNTGNERLLLEQFLIQAVHWYLHYSQLGSWMFQYNVNRLPFSVHYTIDGKNCWNHEQLCTDFKYNNPSFPVCETGKNSSIKKIEAETLCQDVKLSNLRCACLQISPFQDLCLLGKNLSEMFNSSKLDDPAALKRCEQCSNVKNNNHPVTINKQSTAVQGDSVKLAYNTGHQNSRINAAATNDANLHCHVTRSFQERRRKISADQSHHSRSSEKPGKVLSNGTRLVKASSPVRFHRITKLPLTSSPVRSLQLAPVNRFQKSFQFDPSLTTDNMTMKKCSNCHDCESTSGGDSEASSIPLRKRIFSKRRNNLLGSFEESALQGRFTPFGILNGFTIELGASGTFLPPHVRLPVTTIFLDSPPDAPLPYIGRCNLKQLGKKGYHIPKAGNVQVVRGGDKEQHTLFNPQGSVINMFIVQYNLKEMKCRSKTFLRQRTYFMPKSATYKDAKNNRSWLRYLIHLRFASSSSGKLYLHSDIKMLFARKPELDCNNVSLTSAGIRDCATYELRAFNEIPQQHV
ncbi:Uncharacterized protein T4E_5652 [Trichinella pseudospiralis]|uniref:Atos-like conserved domain-containing protein n=1 Tax=Trichinella pseudospiralis TaxID=6337 RepID=A0A0V0XVT5_TRIPS|nr:Uncharacterized protein T4E_5652 [Trichinella pseudospiralis]